MAKVKKTQTVVAEYSGICCAANPEPHVPLPALTPGYTLLIAVITEHLKLASIDHFTP